MKSHHWLLVGALALNVAGCVTFVLSTVEVLPAWLGAFLTYLFWYGCGALVDKWRELR